MADEIPEWERQLLEQQALRHAEFEKWAAARNLTLAEYDRGDMATAFEAGMQAQCDLDSAERM